MKPIKAHETVNTYQVSPSALQRISCICVLSSIKPGCPPWLYYASVCTIILTMTGGRWEGLPPKVGAAYTGWLRRHRRTLRHPTYLQAQGLLMGIALIIFL